MTLVEEKISKNYVVGDDIKKKLESFNADNPYFEGLPAIDYDEKESEEVGKCAIWWVC
jgi:hypothetical protein